LKNILEMKLYLYLCFLTSILAIRLYVWNLACIFSPSRLDSFSLSCQLSSCIKQAWGGKLWELMVWNMFSIEVDSFSVCRLKKLNKKPMQNLKQSNTKIWSRLLQLIFPKDYRISVQLMMFPVLKVIAASFFSFMFCAAAFSSPYKKALYLWDGNGHFAVPKKKKIYYPSIIGYGLVSWWLKCFSPKHIQITWFL